MHSILENFFDNNSFFKTLIEKDKIKLLSFMVLIKRKYFLIIKIQGFAANALSINKIIREY
jgi:hypothetical protein